MIQSPIDIQDDYNQYYLLKLPDHSYILAQMSRSDAAAVRSGKVITLSIGQKVSIDSAARAYLADICTQYGASIDTALYIFDDEWYEENHFVLFLIRFGSASVIFFVLAFTLITRGNKLFHIKISHLYFFLPHIY